MSGSTRRRMWMRRTTSCTCRSAWTTPWPRPAHHLSLVLAHQHLGQITTPPTEAVDANARNKLFFTLTPDDARHLAAHTGPYLTADDLHRLGRYQAACRLVTGHRNTTGFTIITRPPPPLIKGRAGQLRAAARARGSPQQTASGRPGAAATRPSPGHYPAHCPVHYLRRLILNRTGTRACLRTSASCPASPGGSRLACMAPCRGYAMTADRLVPAKISPLDTLRLLTGRDRHILMLVAEHQVLTTDHLTSLAFPSRDRAEQRLRSWPAGTSWPGSARVSGRDQPNGGTSPAIPAP